MSSDAGGVRTAFRELTGRPPEVVAAAPGRVNLIGEHTDYNDGFVLPFALPMVTRAAVGRRPDARLRLRSRQAAADPPVELALPDLRPGAVQGWAAYAAGVVWALAEASGDDLPGLDVVVDGAVPTGAGLSSSAALECAVALALDHLLGADLSPVELARVAQRAENDFVGMPCGVMDQMASMLGRAGHAVFLDTRSSRVRQVPLPLDDAGLALLVVDTRSSHALTDGGYAERRRACELAARTLGVDALRDLSLQDLEGASYLALEEVVRRRVRHVVTENARVLEVVEHLDHGDTTGIGPLMTASHASLRDDYQVSCAELDVVVDTALAHGALGARMTGAGFGGSAVVLLRDESSEEVGARVVEAFAERGWEAPRTFGGLPSEGARIEVSP